MDRGTDHGDAMEKPVGPTASTARIVFPECGRGDQSSGSAQAATARAERSKIIHEPGRLDALLIEEAALYGEAMASQLGRLLTAGALPASLGVIPTATGPAPCGRTSSSTSTTTPSSRWSSCPLRGRRPAPAI
ncbi:Scr1 family TA system antitoxin-like transcriptional regulator [Streptomyces sp. NPDC058206]|uniref:Scr1 family TA system antitoxin-like transcriptional regulator n=1 Tax=Streptomyces sp. NPDC058206 TaxID=3346382 RepID=UPI0036EB08FB